MKREIKRAVAYDLNEKGQRIADHGCDFCELHARQCRELLADGWVHYAPGFSASFDSSNHGTHCWHQHIEIAPMLKPKELIGFDVWFSVARMGEIDRRYFANRPLVQWHVLPPGRDASLPDGASGSSLLSVFHQVLVPPDAWRGRSLLERWADRIARTA